MNDWTFSLSLPSARVLPEAVEANGTAYPMRWDFRTALKIFRLLDDPDVAERHKAMLACKLFYAGEVPPDGVRLMLRRLSPDDGRAKRHG